MKRTVLEQVWNPNQHIALWLAAWLTGQEGYDYTVGALDRLGGPRPANGSVTLVDAWVPDVIDMDKPLGRAEFLRLVRACVDAADTGLESRPIIRLVLAGPGDAPRLPASTDAAKATAEAGAAIVIADADPEWSHVIVPPTAKEQSWRWYSVPGILPEPDHLSPGEADFQLANASREAARAIEASGRRHATKGPDPRLLVGLLDDHLDLAFLPDALPRRAATVIARADAVASILTVAQGNEAGVGTSEFDPQLIPLWRTIRQCRMSAVEYAVREWCRDLD